MLASTKTGTIPEDWKIARITAIYKNKGSKKMAANYRPVSLTSVVCKVLETIVRSHVMNYMKNNKMISSTQFGFLPGRSCALQLLKVLDIWTKALEEGYDIDVIYMDYMKAFDTVPHRRLIGKLKSYKFSSQITSWIQNFLSDRKQFVTVNGENSELCPVLSGIPQGSVLGPVHFTIFINDLPGRVTSEAFLYAYDTKIFNKIKENTDVIDLQKDLAKLTEWSNEWLLKFHPDKCKHMRIGRKSETIPAYTIERLATNLCHI